MVALINDLLTYLLTCTASVRQRHTVEAVVSRIYATHHTPIINIFWVCKIPTRKQIWPYSLNAQKIDSFQLQMLFSLIPDCGLCPAGDVGGGSDPDLYVFVICFRYPGCSPPTENFWRCHRLEDVRLCQGCVTNVHVAMHISVIAECE